jgi:hypothetical protein
VRLQPRSFCCRSSLRNQLMHYCLFFSPLSHHRVLRSLSVLSLYARHQPQVSRPSVSLRAISRKLRRPPHIIGGVLRSLSHPSLSIGVPSAARCGSLRNRNWFITVDCCSSLSLVAPSVAFSHSSLVPLILYALSLLALSLGAVSPIDA